MDSLLASIYHFVEPTVDLAEPVRIAILDSGLDPESPFLIEDQQLANPRVKDARSFIHGTGPHDVRDEIGQGDADGEPGIVVLLLVFFGLNRLDG